MSQQDNEGNTRTRLRRAAIDLFASRNGRRVTVGELAEAAGVARGTIYNAVSDPRRLFECVATELAEEMVARNTRLLGEQLPPAERLAHGIGLWMRQASDDRSWARFITQFAFSAESLQAMWQGSPTIDLARGIETGSFQSSPEQLPSLVALVVGGVIGGMAAVRDGRRPWFLVTTDLVEMVLVALGVDRANAIRLAAEAAEHAGQDAR